MLGGTQDKRADADMIWEPANHLTNSSVVMLDILYF
jgi:hypothetical protein